MVPVIARVAVVEDRPQAAAFGCELEGFGLVQVHERGHRHDVLFTAGVESGEKIDDELLPAIRVAGEVGFTHAGPDFGGADFLRVGMGQGQEHGVAVGHEAGGAALQAGVFAGDVEVAVEQSRGDQLAQRLQVDQAVVDAGVIGDLQGAVEFDRMLLAVVETDGFDERHLSIGTILEAARPGFHRSIHTGCGILAAREDYQHVCAAVGVNVTRHVRHY